MGGNEKELRKCRGERKSTAHTEIGIEVQRRNPSVNLFRRTGGRAGRGGGEEKVRESGGCVVKTQGFGPSCAIVQKEKTDKRSRPNRIWFLKKDFRQTTCKQLKGWTPVQSSFRCWLTAGVKTSNIT